MLVLLAMAMLVRWRLSLDVRRDAAMSRIDVPVLDAKGNEILAAGGGVLRVPDSVKQSFLSEEALHARWSRYARRVLAVVVCLWALLLASYLGSAAELDGAAAMLARCDDLAVDVQACAAPAVETYLDAAGEAAERLALVWIVGLL